MSIYNYYITINLLLLLSIYCYFYAMLIFICTIEENVMVSNKYLLLRIFVHKYN